MNKINVPLSFPLNLALVKQSNQGLYVFRIPYERIVKPGERVLCKTYQGEMPGVVDSVVEIGSQEALDFIMKALDVRRLEPVIARMTRYDYDDTATYYAGRGLEKEDPAGTCVTVHIPHFD